MKKLRGLTLALVATFALGAATGTATGATYGIQSQWVKNYGTTDLRVAVMKPKQVFVGTHGATFLQAKLKSFKHWGSKSTSAKAKYMRICDYSKPPTKCNDKGKAKLTYSKKVSKKCEIKPGKTKRISIYSKLKAKVGKMKATYIFPTTYCPDEFS